MSCPRSTIRRFVVAKRRQRFRAPRTGGLADGRLVTDFATDALVDGVCVELEHTADRTMALRIAMDHLVEHRDYYQRLEAIEANPRTVRLARSLQRGF